MADGIVRPGEHEPTDTVPDDAEYCPSCGEGMNPRNVWFYGDMTLDVYRTRIHCADCGYRGEIIRDGGIDDYESTPPIADTDGSD